jgi:hypothetical protein
MRKGFTVIEVVLTLFLASLISLSLFQLLKQVRRGVKRIVNVIEVDTPLLGFYNQIEKDVTGMFAPFSSIEAYAQKDKAAAKEKERKKIPFASLKEEPLALSSKPIEHVFELDLSQEAFFWSFITTGAIQVLDASGEVTPVPFVRRVAYLLESDPERQGQFRLMYRFSGTQLEVSPLRDRNFKPSYELISGIKRLTIELSLLEVAEKESPTKQAGALEGMQQNDTGEHKSVQTVVPSHTITVKEWRSDEIWSKYKTLIPAYVKLSGVRADATGVEYPFVIVSKVYAYSPYVEKEKSLFDALEDIAKSIWKK